MSCVLFTLPNKLRFRLRYKICNTTSEALCDTVNLKDKESSGKYAVLPSTSFGVVLFAVKLNTAAPDARNARPLPVLVPNVPADDNALVSTSC